MIISMIRKNFFWLVLISLLVLTSCGQGRNDPFVTNYFTGSEGLEIQFIGESPPNELYENSEFPVALFVSNDGAFSLEDMYKGVISYTYDPFYLTLKPGFAQEGDREIHLPGKSYLYPEGGFDTAILPTFKVNPILGQRENPETDLFVNVCYPYKTILTDEICIDTSSVLQDQREKVCRSEIKSYSNQGAPVAITEIRPEFQISGINIKPIFLIKIRNVGAGSVMAPVSESDIPRACEVQKEAEQKRNWNKVNIVASLSGEPLTCTPETIQLFDERGVTRCQLESGGFATSLTYFTNLMVELDYVYSSSISKTISIVRSEFRNLSLLSSETCKFWQTEFGEGNCVDNCELCSINPNHPICLGGYIDSSWSCSCSESDCVEQPEDEEDGAPSVTVRKGDCLHGPGYCNPEPASQRFCCSKQQ